MSYELCLDAQMTSQPAPIGGLSSTGHKKIPTQQGLFQFRPAIRTKLIIDVPRDKS